MPVSAADKWDLRLPNGRLIHGLPTEKLREHIRDGRVPRDSQVRRSEKEEWTILEWVAELVPVAGKTKTARKTPIPNPTNQIQTAAKPAPTTATTSTAEPAPVRLVAQQAAAARTDAENTAARVQIAPRGAEPLTVGSRLLPRRLGMMDVPAAFREVLSALGLTLVRRKLLLGVIHGLCLGTLLLFVLHAGLEQAWPRLLVHGVGAALFLMFSSFTAAILCRMTYQEVSLLRPGRWRESVRGVVPLMLRTLLATLLLVGTVVGLVVAALYVPSPVPGGGWSVFRVGLISLLHALTVVLTALILPLYCLVQLIVPIFVVEECSTFQAVGLWYRLVRANVGRILLHETLALGLALLLIAPPALSLTFLSWSPLQEKCGFVLTVARHLLGGVLVGLALAFLGVVQVFLYLNLRYDTTAR
jgi:hypothetical protein